MKETFPNVADPDEDFFKSHNGLEVLLRIIEEARQDFENELYRCRGSLLTESRCLLPMHAATIGAFVSKHEKIDSFLWFDEYADENLCYEFTGTERLALALAGQPVPVCNHPKQFEHFVNCMNCRPWNAVFPNRQCLERTVGRHSYHLGNFWIYL